MTKLDGGKVSIKVVQQKNNSLGEILSAYRCTKYCSWEKYDKKK